MTDERKPPQIEDAPGLVWRARKNGWVATWQAKSNLIKKGYAPQTARLWDGIEPTEIEAEHIAVQCRRLQGDMRAFARAGGFVSEAPGLTLARLIDKYRTEKVSTWHKKQYSVRKNHNMFLDRIARKFGETELSEIRAKKLLEWHQEWGNNGQKVAVAHAFIGHLRSLFGFGAAILEDRECERLCAVLHTRQMQFPMAPPRNEILTSQQVIAHRVKAHRRTWHYMALAQAFQFELTLRQRDVIGQWVPLAEPGVSDVIRPDKGEKWISGLRWEEIDQNLILRHTTNKKRKDIEVNLGLAPMVLEELAILTETPIAKLTRDRLPVTGPVILCETNGWPYTTAEFRRKWRVVADEAGIPRSVKNMDSRAGAITEATEAGIPVEHIKHAATHSDISMTQRYSRGATEKIASTMAGRVAHRNKAKTAKTDK